MELIYFIMASIGIATCFDSFSNVIGCDVAFDFLLKLGKWWSFIFFEFFFSIICGIITVSNFLISISFHASNKLY